MGKRNGNDIFLMRISEIQACLSAERYLAALSLALTLPDICGKAEYPGEYSATRYIRWYNHYIGDEEKPKSVYDEDMPYLSGEVVYNFRCSFLHSGNPNIDKAKIKEERCQVDQFTVELGKSMLSREASVAYGEGMRICYRSCTVNVRQLCNELCRTAEIYYLENKEKFDFFDYRLTEV